jgi:hypothetical protein
LLTLFTIKKIPIVLAHVEITIITIIILKIYLDFRSITEFTSI